ncbi:hypothetical protein [uncultured Marinobacter sp.]|uniref:hypothetical protein n=1 Tax=uncultured Marinobacter sp. TaxID=187379 RepID=UPI0030DD26B4|tara:strand:+ start:894 stop:1109 length:216 start_codon:yes stop_codon:yes gene_type:complete
MKKIIIVAAMTVLFSTMANANSSLADRINEARSYPDKSAENVVDARTLSRQHKRIHMEMSKAELRGHKHQG